MVYPGSGNTRALAVFLAQANGAFSQFVLSLDPNSQFVADALSRDAGEFADINGDGRKDYVVVYSGTGGMRTFATYLAQAAGIFQVPYLRTDTTHSLQLDVTSGRDMGTFARITGDNYADYVVTYPGSTGERRFRVYPGRSDGRFNAAIDTEDFAGRYLGGPTQKEYGLLGDVQ